MRSVAFVGALLIAGLCAALPVEAQGAADAPAFVVGTNKAYCHAAEDSLSVWMNLLEADGGEVPYQPYGEPTVPAGQNPAMDPVADESFEARIALSPVLAQAITVSGTVNVQAYIGSGAYGGGTASIATSLVVDGTEVGAAEPKDHTMTPKNSNVEPGATYDPITWTFEVPETTVPSGAVLEWVISGTVLVGNNVYLACHEARGRSSIDLPVTAVAAEGPAGGDGGNSTTNGTSSTAPASSSSTSSSSTSTTSRSTSTSTSSTSRSTSSNSTGDGEQDTPAPPLAVAGLAVLAAAFVARRRLR